jgi:hypothetical protein
LTLPERDRTASAFPDSAARPMPDKKYTAFSGRLVIIGFGSIGQGVLPLLLRHVEIRPDQITVITAEPRGHEEAVEYGIKFIELALTRENYRAVLEARLGRGDFLLNVSVDVSSVAFRQAGAARRRARCRSRDCRAGGSRRLGPAGAASRSAGHPHRRAGYAGLDDPEGAGRVRQHLVDRWILQRRLAAGGARLGDA